MVVALLFAFSNGAGDIAKYYPKRAIDNGVEGQATIQCVVLPDGALKECVVLSETPLEYGFGRATVRMFTKTFNVNDYGELGQPHAPGDHVKFTFKWRLG